MERSFKRSRSMKRKNHCKLSVVEQISEITKIYLILLLNSEVNFANYVNSGTVKAKKQISFNFHFKILKNKRPKKN